MITLMVIGVVARVTLPSLMQNVEKQKAETTFVKAINTLETATIQLQQETGIQDVVTAGAEVSGREARADGRGANRVFLDGLNRFTNSIFKEYSAVEVNGTEVYNVPVLITKDGIAFYAHPNDRFINSANANILPPKYSGTAIRVIIDTNGIDKPNKYGRDQFIVMIDRAGQVIPFGGVQWLEFNDFENRDEEGQVLGNYQCAKNTKPSDPTTCAGAIADNSYKILYKYNMIN